VLKHRAPPPPAPVKDLPGITLDIMISAKLALAMALSANKITNVAFADRLGVTEKVVRRLLDPDHSSKIERLEHALGLLGQQLELRVEPRKEEFGSSSLAR